MSERGELEERSERSLKVELTKLTKAIDRQHRLIQQRKRELDKWTRLRDRLVALKEMVGQSR